MGNHIFYTTFKNVDKSHGIAHQYMYVQPLKMLTNCMGQPINIQLLKMLKFSKLDTYTVSRQNEQVP